MSRARDAVLDFSSVSGIMRFPKTRQRARPSLPRRRVVARTASEFRHRQRNKCLYTKWRRPEFSLSRRSPGSSSVCQRCRCDEREVNGGAAGAASDNDDLIRPLTDWCGAVRHGAAWRGAAWCGVVQRGAAQRSAARHGTVQCGAKWSGAGQCTA